MNIYPICGKNTLLLLMFTKIFLHKYQLLKNNTLINSDITSININHLPSFLSPTVIEILKKIENITDNFLVSSVPLLSLQDIVSIRYVEFLIL